MSAGGAADRTAPRSRGTGASCGRALDVGCGEGADAVWLATRGWRVTAIDVSAVAVERAKDAAAAAGVEVDFVVGDVRTVPLPPRCFDLVSLQYPALPAEDGCADIVNSVAPGGVLLAVYHLIDEEHRRHMQAQGSDPAQFVGPDDLFGWLDSRFTLELHSVEPRLDPPPGSPSINDVVIRARQVHPSTTS